MHNLLSTEQEALQQLSSTHPLTSLPAIAIILYLLGGLIAWVSFIAFFLLVGVDKDIIGIVGSVLIIVAFIMYRHQNHEPLLVMGLMILGHLHFLFFLFAALKLDQGSVALIELFFLLLTLRYFQLYIYNFLHALYLFSLLFSLTLTYHLSDTTTVWILLGSFVLFIYLWMRPAVIVAPLKPALLVSQSIFLIEVCFVDRVTLSGFSSLILIAGEALLLSALLWYTHAALRQNLLAFLAVFALIVMTFMTTAGILAVAIYMVLSLYFQSFYLRVYSLILLALFILLYYYNLALPLDKKALVMMASGVLFLALAWKIKTLQGDDDVQA